MPEFFEKRIIGLLRRRDYTPLKLSQLAKALGVSGEDYPEFKLAFEELRRAGRVVIGARNLVSLPPLSGRIIGTFRGNAKGFGFITPLEPNSHGDLFVPPGKEGGAMTGDVVATRDAMVRSLLSWQVTPTVNRSHIGCYPTQSLESQCFSPLY